MDEIQLTQYVARRKSALVLQARSCASHVVLTGCCKSWCCSAAPDAALCREHSLEHSLLDSGCYTDEGRQRARMPVALSTAPRRVCRTSRAGGRKQVKPSLKKIGSQTIV